MPYNFTKLTPEEKEALAPLPSSTKQPSFLFLLFHHPAAIIGIFLLSVIVIYAILFPIISPYNFAETNLSQKNLPPSSNHYFGTDDLGRDVCIRTAWGIRISLFVGIIAAILDTIIGITWGVISGLFGGRVDQIMMKIAEFIYSLPYLLVVILTSVITGPGIFPIIISMLMIGWIQMARITRSQVLQLSRSDYILSAIALGLPIKTIILHHILPNILGPLLACVMLSIPHAIFAEAFLSFLGIGIQPPQASLGSMVSDALSAMRFYPWRLFFPAICISICTLSFTLIGDAIRDILDPQSRKLIYDVEEAI